MVATPRRTIERVLKDMTESGFLEKTSGQYRIRLSLLTHLNEARQVVRQESEKRIWLESKKTSPRSKT